MSICSTGNALFCMALSHTWKLEFLHLILLDSSLLSGEHLLSHGSWGWKLYSWHHVLFVGGDNQAYLTLFCEVTFFMFMSSFSMVIVSTADLHIYTYYQHRWLFWKSNNHKPIKMLTFKASTFSTSVGRRSQELSTVSLRSRHGGPSSPSWLISTRRTPVRSSTTSSRSSWRTVATNLTTSLS